ncbi:MAG: isopentenyl-diphosphate Delta-isomerase [Proteobacteria bacterium]|nr:isopentenyl-diphosphate Delta-isomerase [Pseudomonadota bacterium]
MLSNQQKDVVSFDSELLILVDDQDQEIGNHDKLGCHAGNGTLHRAFSLFIFNDQGELLLQRRSANKLLWPLYWSNSCCSHPRQGENMETAISRRAQQELGIETKFQFLYKFKYQAPYLDIGSEHELCWVFIGDSNGPIRANENEIAEWRFISAENLDKELRQKPEQFTPWFKLEWNRLTKDYRTVLSTLNVSL